MRILLSFVLVLNSGLAFADYRRPAFWNGEWTETYAAFKTKLTEALLRKVVGSEDGLGLREVGEALARMNLLAQQPCRRDPKYCSIELEHLILDGVRDAIKTARSTYANRPAEDVARLDGDLYAVLGGLYSLTNDDVLRAHAVNFHLAWQKTDAEFETIAQSWGVVLFGTVVGGVATYFYDGGIGKALAGAAGGFVIAAVGLMTMYVRAPNFPFTSRFKIERNAVRDPVRTCLSELYTMFPKDEGGAAQPVDLSI